MANEKIINLALLEYFRQLYDKRLKDGTLVVSKSLSAKALENISEESGTVQETPFIIQGTGTANNTELVDTSPVGKQLEKQGNTVVVNQNIPNENKDLNAEALSYGRTLLADNLSIPSGHKFLLMWEQATTLTSIVRNTPVLTIGGTQVYLNVGENYHLSKGLYYWNGTLDGVLTQIDYWCHTPDVDVSYKNFIFIDLTQWFGSNDQIPQDLLDNPSHWSWYQNYGDYIPYNTGEIVNCAGRYLNCGGRNVWDEETQLGYMSYDIGNISIKITANDQLCSKNKTRVIPNTTYYINCETYMTIIFVDENNLVISSTGVSDALHTFTTPSNCTGIYFNLRSTYGTTYKNDITISLYYTTGDSYDEYFPYVAPKVYDTGVEVLRKAGSAKDYKTPDGTVHRVVGSYTFTGEETLTPNLVYQSTNEYRFLSAVIIDEVKKATNNNDIVNILSVVYQAQSPVGTYTGNNGITIDTNGYIYIYDNANNTSTSGSAIVSKLAGTTIYYELATETTESGTPFSENIEIDDYGDMSWKDTNEDYVAIPQGVKLFYPADYALLIDTLNSYVNGDITKLAKKTDLSEYVKQEDLSSQITAVSGVTFGKLKIIKTGKLISFDMQITNSSGSAIPANTKLADLTSAICPTTAYFSAVYSGASLCVGYLHQSQLALKVNIEIPADRTVTFAFSVIDN